MSGWKNVLNAEPWGAMAKTVSSIALTLAIIYILCLNAYG